MNDWISEIGLKRLSQRSNVFIVETEDPKRITQFRKLLKNGDFKKIAKVDFARVLEFDVQRGTVNDIKGDQQLPRDPMKNLMAEFDSFLQAQPTIIIVKYVLSERHAETLTDWLTASAHDDQMYEKKSTIVVFTSSTRLFSEAVRRLVHTVTVTPSTPKERREILKTTAKQLQEGIKEKFGEKIRLKVSEELIQSAAGLTLHDIETAALESFFLHRRFDVKTFSAYKINLLREKDVRFVKPERGFETVGGYQYLKEYIQNNIIRVLRNPDIARHYGLSIPRGIILYGLPGCGKTFIAKALAKEVGLTMIEVSSATFLRGIVGETETRAVQITQLIEALAPVVVFIDEIDELSIRRDKTMITDSGVRRSMQNILMKWLGDEKRRSFIIGATNLLESCDPAFIRVGRIDETILVLPPDYEARKEILRIHANVLRKVPLDKTVNLDEIADKTFLYTGGELEKLVLDAARIAMSENSDDVNQMHFHKVMEGVNVNIKERESRVRQMIQIMQNMDVVNQAFLKQALMVFTKAEKDKSRVKGLIEAL